MKKKTWTLNSTQSLIGSRVGKWMVTNKVETRKDHKVLWCVCECGSEKYVEASTLRGGRSLSCGCDGHKRRAAILSTRNGASRSPELGGTYRSWLHARNRCINPRSHAYVNYGGRGIQMCPEWMDSFDVFLKDMGVCPPGYTIERIDVNGHYEPSNCKWISKADQSKNRRSVRRFDYRGEPVTVPQIAERLGWTTQKASNALRYRSVEQLLG